MPGWHGVQGLAEADVVVGTDGDLLPGRHVVDHPVVGKQLHLLLGLEDLARQLAGRAVDAKAGNVATPALGLLSAVIEVTEPVSLIEALPDVLDPPLDVRLVLRSPHPGRVDEDAAFLRVLEEAARRPWCQGIGSRDRRGEVIDDQPSRNPAEGAPGGLESGDALFERLPRRGKTNWWRLYGRTTTSAQTACFFPERTSPSVPSWPKSNSATSPGGHSAIRTVVFAGFQSPACCT